MEKYTIGQLLLNGIPSDEVCSDLFFDWFCSEKSLARRGKTCLQRLRSLVKAAPKCFELDDTIDIKNCLPCSTNATYDCIRVFKKDGAFRFCVVPKETACTGSSYMYEADNEIHYCRDWKELKETFRLMSDNKNKTEEEVANA